jgi:hypothetical protein
MQIVLISGKQGSGKSTLQNLLVTTWQKEVKGSRAINLNFADILYEMHDKVLSVLHKYWPPRDIIKDGPLLQLLGTQWGRDTIDKNIWVICLHEKIRQLAEQNSHYKNLLFIIGDCRFPNEFEAFPEALRVRLRASEETRKARVSMWRENTNHPSEIALDSYDQADKFDLHFSTDNNGYRIDEMTQLIIAQLLKNSWAEKRGIS